MLYLFLLALPLIAQESDATLTNPFNTAEDIARGQRAFLAQCAACHGADGRGGNAGPDLSILKRANTDEALYQVINKGIPGTVMPGSSSNSAGIWQLVAFVRSIAASRQVQASGNASRGEALYRNQGCYQCHEATAPDLFAAARTRTLNELRESILNPQAEVHDRYWRLRATMLDGQTAAGQRLNEDTETIQFRTAQGQLKTLRRNQIKELTWDKSSPMPAYRDKLTTQQLDDLLAYLLTGGAR
jgi:putative heme-binding domain-containing protein